MDSADLIDNVAKQTVTNDTTILNGVLNHKFPMGAVVSFPVIGETVKVSKGKIIAMSFLDNGLVNYSVVDNDGKVVVMPENLIAIEDTYILHTYYTNALKCMFKEMLDSGMTNEVIQDVLNQACQGLPAQK